MAFVRIKKNRAGKSYRYEETRWREGNKVRSRSVCLGPVDGDAVVLRRGRPYGLDWDAIAREENERMDREAARTAAHVEQLHADFGLKMGPTTPTPEDKPAPTVDLAAPAPAEENASPDGEAGDGKEGA